MALIDELFPASYKGASFLVTKTVTSGGRKDIRHEFPNSDLQSIEDLGLLPRVYDLTAIINEPFYRVKRMALLRALEEGGSGILIHPFFGIVNNIVARSYTINEDLNALGNAQVRILFEISDTIGIPTKSGNTTSLIAQAASSVFGSVTSGIAEVFNVTPSFPNNFATAVDKITSFSDAVVSNVSLLSVGVAQANQFNGLISDFKNTIPKLVQDPTSLATSMSTIMEAVPTLYTSASDQFDVLSQFFTFGQDDPTIVTTTAGLTERKTNNDIITESVQTYALAQAYTSASQISFNTVPEIERVQSVLDDAFSAIKSF